MIFFVVNEDDKQQLMWRVTNGKGYPVHEYTPKRHFDAAGAIICIWNIFEKNDVLCTSFDYFEKEYNITGSKMFEAESNVKRFNKELISWENKNISFAFTDEPHAEKYKWLICSSFSDNQDNRYAVSDGVAELSDKFYKGCMYYKIPRK